MHARTARSFVGDFTATTNLFGAVHHIHQAAAAMIVRRYAVSVVGDVEGQHVGNVDFDGQPRGAGMTDGVAHGFRGDRFGMLGKLAADGGRRPVHPHSRDDVTVFGEVGDHALDTTPEATFVPQRGFQVEDAGADLLDNGLEIVQRAVESLDDLRRTRPGDRAL